MARGVTVAAPADAEVAKHKRPWVVLQELSEWACIYIKYLQIFRKLETAYDQMLQPQKRQDMKKTLEACMGRMLEIRHWMVRAGMNAAAWLCLGQIDVPWIN